MSDKDKLAVLAEHGWDYQGLTGLGHKATKRLDQHITEQVGEDVDTLVQRVLAWEDYQTSRK